MDCLHQYHCIVHNLPAILAFFLLSHRTGNYSLPFGFFHDPAYIYKTFLYLQMCIRDSGNGSSC